MPSGPLHDQRPIRVIVSDNTRFHCDLLAQALQRDQTLLIVGSASSSRELVELAGHNASDVVIISANLDDDPMRGLTFLREFHATYPQIPSIVLLDSPTRETVLQAFRSGARGIFNRHEALESLCRCIRVVHTGQIWASSREVKYALEALSSGPTIRAVNAGGLNLLTPRELQVVQALAEGLTNREIALCLRLSPHTIKNYVMKIFDKLGVSNRVELVFRTCSQPSLVQRAAEEESKDLKEPAQRERGTEKLKRRL
jgi:two-component system nitrate/nitrite response regulator NarL